MQKPSGESVKPFWPDQWENPDPLFARCMAGVQAGIASCQTDPLRPRFHFLPPARWMNDVFGAVFRDGWYHIFYGLHPFSDRDNEFKCFGHARSQDLVYWEHLPIALVPVPDQGQLRCNDGTITFNSHGDALLFFTFVPVDSSTPRQHWLAYGDPSLENWQLFGENPVLSMANHGGPPFKHIWTDPYIFKVDRRTFMTISKCLPLDGGPGVLPLYESVDPSLLRWKYQGDFHDRTGEVVNFFQLQDRWVLLRSPFNDIEYETGQFDLEELRFKPGSSGKLSYGYIRQDNPTSRGLYASDVYETPDGRRVLVGWISGFPEGRGWNGCMSLPRVLTIDAHERLCQEPLPELKKLRGEPTCVNDRIITDGSWSPHTAFSPSLEISLTFKAGTARQVGLRLFNQTQPDAGLKMIWDGDKIRFNDLMVPLDPAGMQELDLHLFVDQLIVEAFIDAGRGNITQCVTLDGTDLEIEFFAIGGSAALSDCTIWPVKAIW